MEIWALTLAFSKSLLFVLAAILPVINPLASAPLFIDLTHGLSRSTRATLARHIGRHVTVILIGAMLIGNQVLSLFGISIPVVRIAGGLVIASIAWRMLNAQQFTGEDQTQMAQSVTESNIRIRAFYPLTFPVSCGPGTISVAIAVGASLNKQHMGEAIANFAGGLVAMILLGLLVGVTLRYADRLMKLLGEVGQIVFMRLVAFLLLCIGVEIMWEGVRALLRELGS